MPRCATRGRGFVLLSHHSLFILRLFTIQSTTENKKITLNIPLMCVATREFCAFVASSHGDADSDLYSRRCRHQTLRIFRGIADLKRTKMLRIRNPTSCAYQPHQHACSAPHRQGAPVENTTGNCLYH